VWGVSGGDTATEGVTPYMPKEKYRTRALIMQGHPMTPEKSMTLERLAEWMQGLTPESCFSGVTISANTVSLAFYSHEDHTLCTANVELEEGTVEWTYA